MIWMFWAILLLGHGAFSRWARTSSAHAFAAIFGDGLLIAIGLFTVEQLQGVGLGDFLRLGLFFVAFGTAGHHLMDSVLQRYRPGLRSRA